MSLRNRTPNRLFVTNVTGLLLACFVVSSLKLMFSGLFQKDLFKGGLSLEECFFNQSYCHARYTRFAVFFPVPSLLSEQGREPRLPQLKQSVEAGV